MACVKFYNSVTCVVLKVLYDAHSSDRKWGKPDLGIISPFFLSLKRIMKGGKNREQRTVGTLVVGFEPNFKPLIHANRIDTDNKVFFFFFILFRLNSCLLAELSIIFVLFIIIIIIIIFFPGGW